MSFCRFCANIKSPDCLVDLFEKPEQLASTREQLVELGVADVVNIRAGDALPLNVCFRCLELLEESSGFVKDIVNAQKYLRDLFLNSVKKEKCEITAAEHFQDASIKQEEEKEPDFNEIKSEDDFDDSASFSDTEFIPGKRQKVKKKKRKLKTISPESIYEGDITWDIIPIKCSKCNVIFSSVNNVRDHSKCNHKTCNAFKCFYCDRSKFTNFKSFLAHSRRHEASLKYSCHICSEKFNGRASLNTHSTEHGDNSCNLCGEYFESEETLIQHSNTYQSARIRKRKKLDDSKENVTCDICNKVFKSRPNLIVHMALHTARTRNHTCEICGKTFFNKGTLTSHMVLHTDARPFKCKICGMSFKKEIRLRSHVQTHTSVKPFSCEQCGKSFRLRHQLTSHMVVHSDNMPHTCEYCGRAFRFKTLLTQHFRQHTGAKPYSCQQCSRDFTNWANYNKHMKRRHKLDMSKKKRTPEGVYPVDPATGEIQRLLENAEEWKKDVMMRKPKRGRPKVGADIPGIKMEIGDLIVQTTDENIAG